MMNQITQSQTSAPTDNISNSSFAYERTFGFYLRYLVVLIGMMLFSSISLSQHTAMPTPSERVDMPVDINAATVEELAVAMRGVGRVIARRIVDYREENGPFVTIDDLTEVRGIGRISVERNRSQIFVDLPKDE